MLRFHAFRRFLPLRRPVATLLILLALAMRVAVPAGYMPSTAPDGSGASHLTLSICDGTARANATVVLPLRPGHPRGGPLGDHGNASTPCPFAALALALLAPAPLLASALPPPPTSDRGLRPAADQPPANARYWLPPQRGPPTTH